MKTLVCCSFAVMSLFATAQDSVEEACEGAAELYADNDIKGALEEAKWCVTLLEQEQQQQVNQVFPDDVLDFQGAQVEHQNVMGFSATVRKYSKGNKEVSVTLSAGAGMNQALAAMAQFSGNGSKTRIQKRNATIISSSHQTQILVTLKKGGMLMFESNDIKKDQLVEFARAFPVAKLDESRQ